MLGRRRLSIWVIGSHHVYRKCCWELPQSIAATEVTSISSGVKSLIAFSPKSSQLWMLPINSSHLTVDGQWKCLNLPVEGRECVLAVSSGLSHTAVLSDVGKVYSHGSSYFGQIGHSVSVDSLSLVKHLECPVKQVVCGLDHTVFLLEDGRVFACGWAVDGQTGTGSYQNSYQISRVELGVCRIDHLSTLADSSFAVTDEGRVFCWGNNEYGQLGVHSDQPQLASPQPVDCSCMDGPVSKIAAGGSFTAFLTTEGSVYVSGSIGMHDSDLAREVHCGKLDRVVALDAGLNYLLAMTSPSTGLVWGKLHLQDYSRFLHCGSKFRISKGVLHLSCGPLGIAALTDSTNPEILELE